MATSLYNDDSFDVKALIAPVYPHAVIPRRPSSVPSEEPSPPGPLPRRSSSTSTNLSATSASSSRLGSLSPSTVGELSSLAESSDFESALQLENLPSPRMSPRVVPGYELGGYAFPADLERGAAASAIADIAQGRADPFQHYQGGARGALDFEAFSSSSSGREAATPTKESIVATPRPRPDPNSQSAAAAEVDSYFPTVTIDATETHADAPSPAGPWTQEGPGDYVSVNK